MSSALALNIQSSLPQSISRAFSTPSKSKVEQLLWRYEVSKKSLNETYKAVQSFAFQESADLLLKSGLPQRESSVNSSFSQADIKKALLLLDQKYWEQAMALTDVEVHMPQKRRSEWNESIESLDFPEFTEENVISSLITLLRERDQFVAERVDGAFRNLSSQHLTNVPQGFRARMIISGIHSDSYPDTEMCGYLTDLRIVVSRFMHGERASEENLKLHNIGTYDLIRDLVPYPGEWHEIDGGAMRIKVYKKGTAHLEVHPDVAWQLNEILAFLYPRAIPPEFRQKPKAKVKSFNLTMQLVPFDILKCLRELTESREFLSSHRGYGKVIPGVYELRGTHNMDKHQLRKCDDILQAIGGEKTGHVTYKFDYDVLPVIKTIHRTGLLPDKVSHQYYPTPENEALELVKLLTGLPGDRLLEPEAGQGNIAVHLKGDVTCVDVSSLNCQILKKKGMENVVEADFLKWAEKQSCAGVTFDGICMNPPFSLGRAELHINAAIGLLSKDGVLASIAPKATAIKLQKQHPGLTYSDIPQDSFPGISIEMVRLKFRNRRNNKR